MGILIDNKYIPAFYPQEDPTKSPWVLGFSRNKLIMTKREGKLYIPGKSDLGKILPEDEKMLYMGSYEGHDCYCIILKEDFNLPEDMELVERREMTPLSDDAGLFLLAGAAHHILHWSMMNQFCGRCGHKNEDKKDERAKVCPNCANLVYPRISPATITAVFRDDQILLAHNRNFRPNFYSLIAGYVEAGETLEQCVEREIFEEVGIKVKNIRYFSSQPWSFPDALMLAFTAEYESGDINVDQEEITDAAWYSRYNLPVIPTTDSIAGKIIKWYQEGNSL